MDLIFSCRERVQKFDIYKNLFIFLDGYPSFKLIYIIDILTGVKRCICRGECYHRDYYINGKNLVFTDVDGLVSYDLETSKYEVIVLDQHKLCMVHENMVLIPEKGLYTIYPSPFLKIKDIKTTYRTGPKCGEYLICYNEDSYRIFSFRQADYVTGDIRFYRSKIIKIFSKVILNQVECLVLFEPYKVTIFESSTFNLLDEIILYLDEVSIYQKYLFNLNGYFIYDLENKIYVSGRFPVDIKMIYGVKNHRLIYLNLQNEIIFISIDLIFPLNHVEEEFKHTVVVDNDKFFIYGDGYKFCLERELKLLTLVYENLDFTIPPTKWEKFLSCICCKSPKYYPKRGNLVETVFRCFLIEDAMKNLNFYQPIIPKWGIIETHQTF